MTGDAEHAQPASGRDRRRGSGRLLTLAAVLLLLGGGTAVGAGLMGQQSPPQPPAATSAPDAAPPPGAPPGPTATPPATRPAPPAAAVPEPVSLAIPAIDVSTDLITVGLNGDGTLQVPSGASYDKAAWYEGSPAPGATGPAVIEGHVDSARSGPSVFFRLGDLRAGDEVRVARADGSTVTFVVDAVRSYPKDRFPTLEVYGNTPGAELRLITCGGDFDSGSGHYENNIVVFAHLTT